MPAQPNPEQRDRLEALNAGDATMGESRLSERDRSWYLHVTATRDVEECSEVSTEERTAIGVDIGEVPFVTVCHRDRHGSPFVTDYEMMRKNPLTGRVPVTLVVVPHRTRDDDSFCLVTNCAVLEDAAEPLAEAYRRR